MIARILSYVKLLSWQDIWPLLSKAAPQDMRNALLMSIGLGYEQITEKFLRHPNYLKLKQWYQSRLEIEVKKETEL